MILFSILYLRNTFERMEQIIKNADSSRYTIFPIKHANLWEFYQKHLSAFWTTSEVPLVDDIADWNNKLSENEKYFIKNVLAFFAASDGIVNENLVLNFYNEVQLSEARAFYSIQMMMESIHCVGQNTQILTDKGYFNIKSLKDKHVNVWNGYAFSDVIVKKTSEHSKLYKVKLSNGIELDCTSEHKWHIQNKDIVLTKNLEKGDKIINEWQFPVINPIDPDLFLNPSLHGYVCGKTNITDCAVMVNKNTLTVPINYSQNTKLRWLEGIFNAKGNCINSCIYIENIQNVSFLKKIQLLLSTIGLNSIVKENDNCIYLGKKNSQKLVEIGFKPKRNVLVENNTCTDNIDDIITVESVDFSESNETYCFNEPLNHTGIFNGILTGQSEQYSLLIDTYISDVAEKKKLFNAVETIPAVKKKATWAIKWIEEGSSIPDSLPPNFLDTFRKLQEKLKGDNNIDTKEENKEYTDVIDFFIKDRPSFAQRLLAFICVEGIFFSGSFCAIYWLKSRGLMPGLATANEFISRDENLHAEFAIELYKMLENTLDESVVHDIFKEAVMIEKEFITESLPVSLIGMNCKLMSEYIENVADRWLIMLGYSKIYNTPNPFGFMEMISLNTKVNFFEGKNSTYIRPGIGQKEEDRSISFDEDEDF